MLETLPDKRIAAEPPKRWRNRYWLTRRIAINGEPSGPGHYTAKFVWPSRDIAESVAERRRETLAAVGAEYLGATPDA